MKRAKQRAYVSSNYRNLTKNLYFLTKKPFQRLMKQLSIWQLEAEEDGWILNSKPFNFSLSLFIDNSSSKHLLNLGRYQFTMKLGGEDKKLHVAHLHTCSIAKTIFDYYRFFHESGLSKEKTYPEIFNGLKELGFIQKTEYFFAKGNIEIIFYYNGYPGNREGCYHWYFGFESYYIDHHEPYLTDSILIFLKKYLPKIKKTLYKNECTTFL